MDNLGRCGFHKDVEKLLDSFINNGVLLYNEFVQLWQDMKFSLVFRGISSLYELVEFISNSFTITKLYLFDTEYSVAKKLGALYILYGLYYRQPTKINKRPAIQIRLSFEEWNELNDFIEILKSQEYIDAVFIYYKLLFDHAFDYVFFPKIYGNITKSAKKKKDRSKNKLDIEMPSTCEILEKLFNKCNFTIPWKKAEIEYNRISNDLIKQNLLSPDKIKQSDYIGQLAIKLSQEFDEKPKDFESPEEDGNSEKIENVEDGIKAEMLNKTKTSENHQQYDHLDIGARRRLMKEGVSLTKKNEKKKNAIKSPESHIHSHDKKTDENKKNVNKKLDESMETEGVILEESINNKKTNESKENEDLKETNNKEECKEDSDDEDEFNLLWGRRSKNTSKLKVYRRPSSSSNSILTGLPSTSNPKSVERTASLFNDTQNKNIRTNLSTSASSDSNIDESAICRLEKDLFDDLPSTSKASSAYISSANSVGPDLPLRASLSNSILTSLPSTSSPKSVEITASLFNDNKNKNIDTSLSTSASSNTTIDESAVLSLERVLFDDFPSTSKASSVDNSSAISLGPDLHSSSGNLLKTSADDFAASIRANLPSTSSISSADSSINLSQKKVSFLHYNKMYGENDDSSENDMLEVRDKGDDDDLETIDLVNNRYFFIDSNDDMSSDDLSSSLGSEKYNSEIDDNEEKGENSL